MKFKTHLFIAIALLLSISISTAQVLQSSKSSNSVQKVDGMIQIGMYQEAMNILNAYLIEFPNDEEALIKRIRIHAVLGNDELKKIDIETASQNNPLFALKYSSGKRASIIRLPQVDYSPFASETSFKKKVFDPKLSDTMYKMHCGKYYNQNLKEVIDLIASSKLQEALHHREFDQPHRYQLVHYDLISVIYLMLDEPNKSLAYAKEALTENPIFSLTKHHKSMIYQSLGQYEKALNEINDAIGIDEDIALYHFTKAQLLEVMDMNEEAILSYKLSMDYKAKYTESQINIGRLLVNIGRTEQGIKYIKQADWSQNDQLIDIKISGINSFINGDYEKAIEEFTLCLDAPSSNPIIKHNLAISYIAINDRKSACTLIDDLLNEKDFSINSDVLNYCGF